MWVLYQVESTSDRVRDQVVGREATSNLPFTHPVYSVSSLPWVLPVDVLDEGVALAWCEDPDAWLISKSAVACSIAR